jgi:hypothetical protein
MNDVFGISRKLQTQWARTKHLVDWTQLTLSVARVVRVAPPTPMRRTCRWGSRQHSAIIDASLDDESEPADYRS